MADERNPQKPYAMTADEQHELNELVQILEDLTRPKTKIVNSLLWGDHTVSYTDIDPTSDAARHIEAMIAYLKDDSSEDFSARALNSIYLMWVKSYKFPIEGEGALSKCHQALRKSYEGYTQRLEEKALEEKKQAELKLAKEKAALEEKEMKENVEKQKKAVLEEQHKTVSGAFEANPDLEKFIFLKAIKNAISVFSVSFRENKLMQKKLNKVQFQVKALELLSVIAPTQKIESIQTHAKMLQDFIGSHLKDAIFIHDELRSAIKDAAAAYSKKVTEAEKARRAAAEEKERNEIKEQEKKMQGAEKQVVSEASSENPSRVILDAQQDNEKQNENKISKEDIVQLAGGEAKKIAPKVKPEPIYFKLPKKKLSDNAKHLEAFQKETPKVNLDEVNKNEAGKAAAEAKRKAAENAKKAESAAITKEYLDSYYNVAENAQRVKAHQAMLEKNRAESLSKKQLEQKQAEEKKPAIVPEEKSEKKVDSVEQKEVKEVEEVKPAKAKKTSILEEYNTIKKSIIDDAKLDPYQKEKKLSVEVKNLIQSNLYSIEEKNKLMKLYRNGDNKLFIKDKEFEEERIQKVKAEAKRKQEEEQAAQKAKQQATETIEKILSDKSNPLVLIQGFDIPTPILEVLEEDKVKYKTIIDALSQQLKKESEDAEKILDEKLYPKLQVKFKEHGFQKKSLDLSSRMLSGIIMSPEKKDCFENMKYVHDAKKDLSLAANSQTLREIIQHRKNAQKNLEDCKMNLEKNTDPDSKSNLWALNKVLDVLKGVLRTVSFGAFFNSRGKRIEAADKVLNVLQQHTISAPKSKG